MPADTVWCKYPCLDTVWGKYSKTTSIFDACRFLCYRMEAALLNSCVLRLYSLLIPCRSDPKSAARNSFFLTHGSMRKAQYRHEALLDLPLYRIFADVKPDKLEPVRELTLRDVQLFSESSNIFPANIVPIVACLVNKHNNKVLQALRVDDRSRRRHLHFLRSAGRGNQTAA